MTKQQKPKIQEPKKKRVIKKKYPKGIRPVKPGEFMLIMDRLSSIDNAIKAERAACEIKVKTLQLEKLHLEKRLEPSKRMIAKMSKKDQN